MVRFTQMAGELMADALGEAERQRDILAVAGNFRRPLGSVSKGTVRATSTDDGLESRLTCRPVRSVTKSSRRTRRRAWWCDR